MLFKSADFSGTDWLNDFEARFPDDDAINAEYEAGTRKPINLMTVTQWVVSTKDNPTKFKAEVAEYFDVENLLAYYLITELFAMVDQRAKNMFLTRYHGDNKWRFIFYDNDTVAGINNEGLIAFGYGVEYHDIDGTLNVFNGESSVLWNNVEAAFPDEIAAMYKDIRSKGYLSYDYVMSVLNGEQSDRWCEAIYNADGRFKYVEPLIQDGNGSYLYAAQGSRAEHRKWWLYNRFLYMDSKYTAGDFLSDFATMRLYTPQSWAGVAPNADFTIIPFADQYVMVKYGSYMVGQRGKKGIAVTIKAPDIVFNDTETIVYGASRVKSLGDLSGKYAGTVDMSKAIRLSDLHIGSEADGYHNDNLTVLSIGSNKMLARLNVQNCPSLAQALDLSACDNIEEIYAQGSGITSVVLPPAGILTKLYLPETVTNLTLKNQPKLKTFDITGVRQLTTIIYENTPVDIMSVIERCMEVKNPALSRVRLIDIDSSGANLTALAKLTKVGGIDAQGDNIPLAVVTGKYYAEEAAEDKLAAVKAAFPDLTVTYTTLKPPTITTFQFSSSQSKAIANAVFTCNFEFKKVNEYTYKVIADDDETIEFTFKCENHEDFSESYVVAGTRSQGYKVTYIPLRKIRVQVYSQSIYPQNARLTIGDQVYITDQDGYVNIRSGAAVEGKVAATGYSGSDFSFGAIVNDASYTVYVYVTVEVKFIVKNQLGLVVNGATIECNEKSGETNQYGECVLLIGKGTYEYKVTHGSLHDYTGSVTVSTSAMTVNVPLIDITPLYYKPEENDNIQIMQIGTKASFSIRSTTTDYIIDWGDGTETSAIGIDYQNYDHTYSDEGFHQIEIRNSVDVLYCYMSSYKNLVAYWSLGISKVQNVSFGSCSNLIYFGNVFRNDTNRTNAQYLFNECNSIISIDLTPLASWVNVTSVEYMFSNCKKLTTIDLTPLASWVNVTNAYNFLNGCSGLTTIDLSPLSSWVKVTKANRLLCSCGDLSTIDLRPLSSWVNVTDIRDMMNGLRKLTTIDLTPLASWVNVADASYLFSFFTSLTTVDLTPLASWVNVVQANSIFYQCGRIKNLDIRPLSSWVKVTNASSLFEGCSQLTTIDLTPLSSWIKVTNARSLFSYCTSLTSVDLAPLSNWVNVVDAPHLLKECSKLITIDLTPLSKLTKMRDNSTLILSCTKLTYIIINASIPFTLSSGALTNGNTCPIYVPDDAVEAYKTATNWSAYADRIKPMSDFATDFPDEV